MGRHDEDDEAPAMSETLVGVDTGGTFTDLVLLTDGRITIHKVPSTPDDPARAILHGLDDLGVRTTLTALVHGSTVATNAVLEQKGAVSGLLTTEGFRDVLEIGRQTRPKLYDLRVQKAPPLVPRERRIEVRERLDQQGNVLVPLDEASLPATLTQLRARGVEAVAISLLFSFANPAHEQAVAQAARDAGFYVSASHEVLPEFREYERTSTVVLNAYVGPLISRYLAHLEGSLPRATPLRIMQSNGGSISSATARREAARTLLSGPAAGVVGAMYVAQASDYTNILTLDIGGTSTDVAMVRGALVETTDGAIGGYPTKLPMIDIHTVGAGGGSIAWFDTGGALRVGPRSAGAYPGPAAYGRGGEEATVTDAHIVLGRLLPEAFLGGSMSLDADAARRAVGRIAARLEMSPEEAALGIIRIANANMEAALRVISVARGIDPRQYTLVAFGGAGPLHACELAEALRIPRVLVPSAPGVLSSLGMLVADVLKDYVRTVMRLAGEAQAPVTAALAELEAQGRHDLAAEGVAEERIAVEQFVDMRYSGQSYELVVPFTGDIARAVSAFHAAHEERFGYSNPDAQVQVVNVRLKARGRTDRPTLSPPAPASESVITPPPRFTRPASFAEQSAPRRYDTAIYARESLQPGTVLSGPAILTQYDTTTVLPPGWEARLDTSGNLIAERADAKGN